MLKFGVLVAISLLAIGQAQAAVITGDSVIAVSSEFTGISRAGSNVVSGAGFVAPPGAFTVNPTNTMWLTQANPTAPISITFSLGGFYNLTNTRIWNYNENSGSPTIELARGVRTGDVQISTDDVLFTTIANISLAQAPGVNNVDFSQVVALSGTAAYIRFTNLVSFGTAANNGDNHFTGLSQVQFSGDAVASGDTSVPEPFSAALLAVGLAATWLLRRRESF